MSNVPKLRFKEFSGKWEKKTVGDVGKVSMCKRILKDQTTSDGDIPFYKIGTFGKEPDAFISKEIFEEFKAKYSFPKEGEILISASGTIGRTVIYDGSPSYFQDSNIVWIANNEKLALNKFLLYCYENTRWNTENTTIARLYNENLRNIPLILPSKQEQEKIALFFTSIDTKIEQLSKKEELLQQYKKGVMQKIFNQKIRFKADDGSEFCDWEEKSVGQCIIHIGGTALEKYVSDKAEYNFISIGNYSTTGKYIDNGQRVILNEKTKTKLLEKDDLVMVLNDKTSSGDIIGSTIYIDKNDKYIYNQRSERIICKDSILPLYFWHYFNSQLFRKKVFSLAQGGTQIYINFSSIKSIETSIPCFEEQIKIANFLSSIDSKIEQVQKQLNLTKEFKKALLQQMFV